jgi:hypothetical protein
LALAAGVNPKVVSERLGHATVSFTLDTYKRHARAARGPGGEGCGAVQVKLPPRTYL